MKKRRGVWLAGAVATAVAVAVSQGFAQEGGAQEKNGKKTEGGEAARPPEKIFEPLVQVMDIRGQCEVNNPDVGKFAPMLPDKAYPLGTRFRTGPSGKVTLVFSSEEAATLGHGTEVVVTAGKTNPDTRVVRLVRGTIKTRIRDNPPDGCFNVVTENASCNGISGRGEYSLAADADFETFRAVTVTGSAEVKGPQYRIPSLSAANTVNIRTAPGRALTRLTSESGDFEVELESGEEKPISYVLTPKAVIKMWRENAPVGGRTIVSVLAMNHKGMMQHRFAFAVGRSELATGELVPQPENAEDAEAASVPEPPPADKEKQAESGAETEKDAETDGGKEAEKDDDHTDL